MTALDFSGPPEIKGNLAHLGTIGSFGAQSTRFISDPSDFEVVESPNLFVALFNRPRRASYRVGGSVYRKTEFAAGDLVVVPQTADWIVDFETEVESLCVFLPNEAIAQALGESAASTTEEFAPLCEASFRAPFVEALVRRLQAEAKGGAPLGALYSDALISALVLELRALARPETAAPGRTAGPLDAAQMAKLTSFVHGNLEEKITAPDLAAQLDMPSPEFSSAFREAFGQTPYQFVMACRIEQAHRMIVETSMSLKEIAYSVDFASQSHMTDTFRSKVGMSPGKLRDTR
jgi:AraC family transcriptional regulator